MLLNCKLLLFRYEIKNWGLTRFHRLGTEQPSYSVLPNGCMPIVFIFQYFNKPFTLSQTLLITNCT